MFSNNPSFNNNIMWSILAALTVYAIMLTMPAMVLAATPKATDTGFGAAAYEVYSILDGQGAVLVALLGGGLAVASMILRPSVPLIAGGAGVGIAAAVAPDLVVTLSGGSVIL